jgi:hypothetical protein
LPPRLSAGGQPLPGRDGRRRSVDVVGERLRNHWRSAFRHLGRRSLGDLICHGGIHLTDKILLEEVPLCPLHRGEHLGRDHAFLESALPGSSLAFVEIAVAVLLPEPLVQVQIHFQVPLHR